MTKTKQEWAEEYCREHLTAGGSRKFRVSDRMYRGHIAGFDKAIEMVDNLFPIILPNDATEGVMLSLDWLRNEIKKLGEG